MLWAHVSLCVLLVVVVPFQGSGTEYLGIPEVKLNFLPLHFQPMSCERWTVGAGNRKSFEERLNLVIFKFNFEGMWFCLELSVQGWELDDPCGSLQTQDFLC